MPIPGSLRRADSADPRDAGRAAHLPRVRPLPQDDAARVRRAHPHGLDGPLRPANRPRVRAEPQEEARQSSNLRLLCRRSLPRARRTCCSSTATKRNGPAASSAGCCCSTAIGTCSVCRQVWTSARDHLTAVLHRPPIHMPIGRCAGFSQHAWIEFERWARYRDASAQQFPERVETFVSGSATLAAKIALLYSADMGDAAYDGWSISLEAMRRAILFCENLYLPSIKHLGDTLALGIWERDRQKILTIIESQGHGRRDINAVDPAAREGVARTVRRGRQHAQGRGHGGAGAAARRIPLYKRMPDWPPPGRDPLSPACRCRPRGRHERCDADLHHVRGDDGRTPHSRALEGEAPALVAERDARRDSTTSRGSTRSGAPRRRRCSRRTGWWSRRRD